MDGKENFEKEFSIPELKEKISLFLQGNIDHSKSPEELYNLAMENILQHPDEAREFILQSAIQHYPPALNKLKVSLLVMPELFNFKRIDIPLAKLLCEELASFKNEFQERARYDIRSAFLFGTYGEFKDQDEAIKLIEELEESEGNKFATEFLDTFQHIDSGDLEEFIRGYFFIIFCKIIKYLSYYGNFYNITFFEKSSPRTLI